MGQTNDEKKYCVYRHIFPNGKCYIGQTHLKPEYRWGSDGSGYLKKNKDGVFGQPLMAHAVQKYDWNDVEHIILFDNLTLDEANRIEQICIALFRSADSRFGYNLTHGGCGMFGFHLSDEAKEKIRQSNMRRVVTEETKEKIRKTNTGKFAGEKNPRYGKKASDETRKKISDALKGKYVGENNPNYGRVFGEEMRKKLSIKNKGKKLSKETRNKMSEVRKGHAPTSYKTVFCEELKLVFTTIKVAADYTKSNYSGIAKCCKGIQETAGKYHWHYATKEEIEQYKIINSIEVA